MALTASERRKRFHERHPERQAEYNRQYRERHPERKTEDDRRYYERHRQRAIDNARDWALANPERKYEIQRRYEALKKALRRDAHLNPEELRAVRVIRNRENVRRWRELYPERARTLRLRRRTAQGSCSPAQWGARLAYYGWRCWMCGAPWEHIDHVIPIVRGGSNWPANLRPACQPCNSRKGARLI